MFDALRRGDKPRIPADSPRPRQPEPPLPQSTQSGAADSEELQADIPFIEVGPRHSMEASPDVMNSQPRWTKAVEEEKSSGHADAATHVPPISPAVPPEEPAPTMPRRPARMALELVSYHRPHHPISLHYRKLAESLLGSSSSQVLMFTSALTEAGTTTTMLNLAISAVRQSGMGKRRAVVVDGNWRRPALADRLGLRQGPGMREVLAGTASVEQSLQETDQIGLWALPAGRTALRITSAPEGGPRFLAETMRSLFRQLRQRYDLVLVDGPRWDGQADVVLLGTACDSVYLVVPEDEAESPQVEELYQLIPEQGGQLAGCIVP
jgi:Mrp family chromosome partitioning ATPase